MSGNKTSVSIFMLKCHKWEVSPSYCAPVFGFYSEPWLRGIAFTVHYVQCYCCVAGGQWNSEALVLSLILNGRLKCQSLWL